MPVTQYIGSRYVPLFADPAEWSSTKTYEPLTIVMHQGNSYTSKQFVPVGIDIANTDFWAETGNYNAQVEQYRREVADYREYFEQKPFAFATVSEMQNYEHLYKGAICHTNGFHKSGDGGAAWYVISDVGDANGMDVIACSETLRANYVHTEQFINPEAFGAHGSANAAPYINKALEYGNIVINNDYIVNVDENGRCVIIPSNRDIIINSTITLNTNDRSDYAILFIDNVDNINIKGCGTIKGDSSTHIGSTGEYGMGIQILRSTNVAINQITITDCWGDGIYVGSGDIAPCENINICNCNIYHNGRNNISIVSAINCIVENCTLNNAYRIAPRAGIDVEPNNNEVDTCKNIKISNCICNDNTGVGISVVDFTEYDAKNSVYINDCISNTGVIVYTTGTCDTTIDNTVVEPDKRLALQYILAVAISKQSNLRTDIIAKNTDSNTILVQASRDNFNININMNVYGDSIRRISNVYQGELYQRDNIYGTFLLNMPQRPTVDVQAYKFFNEVEIKFTSAAYVTDQQITVSPLGGNYELIAPTSLGVLVPQSSMQIGTTMVVKNSSSVPQPIRVSPTHTLASGHYGIYKALEYGKMYLIADIATA